MPVHFIFSGVAAGTKRSDHLLVFQDISSVKRLEAEVARSRRLASLGIIASKSLEKKTLAVSRLNGAGGYMDCNGSKTFRKEKLGAEDYEERRRQWNG